MRGAEMGGAELGDASAHVLAPLLELARAEPDRHLLTFVGEQGEDESSHSAASLLAAAARVGVHLRERCGLQAGEVVLLVYPPGMAFVEAFAGCLLAGIVPAPVYPPHPGQAGAKLEQLAAIAARAGAKAMLTTRTYRWAVRVGAGVGRARGRTPRWPALPWIVTEGLRRGPSQLEPAPVRADEVALLQFTSGSTSAPKGVRLTHANLRHQLRMNAEDVHIRDGARMAMWVPQYHDLGLISGVTSALCGLGQLWFMSPQTFLHRPELWFAVADRVRATHLASPNFGYALSLRKIDAQTIAAWDLSRVQVTMSAAEPIVPSLMDAFFDAFEPAGLDPESFFPAYGLAEHAVGVTLGGQRRLSISRATLAREGLARPDVRGDLELVGCGRAGTGVELCVVDPATLEPRPDLHEGEIFVRSPSVADGYEGDEAATVESFGVAPRGHEHQRGWLRTGDLGLLHRGELFVTGRRKDLIIVRGRNLHPEDLEEGVRDAHPGIRKGGVVAFASLAEYSSEGVVVLVEARAADDTELPAIVAAVSARIGANWGLRATVAVVAPRTLLKTTSGKIRRGACRRAWLDGELPVLERAAPSVVAPMPVSSAAGELRESLLRQVPSERLDSLQAAVTTLLAEVLDIDPRELEADTFLPGLGLSSVLAVELVSRLGQSLGRELPPTLFVEHPSVREAACRLLRELGLEFEGEAGTQQVEIEMLRPLPWRPPPRELSPARTKVAVVGGGPAGLVAAYELARLGYREITVLEASSRWGGKVHTAEHAGQQLELGQLYILNTYQTILTLCAELGVGLELAESEQWVWERGYGLEPGAAVEPLARWCTRVLRAARLPVASHAGVLTPALFEGPDESFGAFLRRHGLQRLPSRFGLTWHASGYGADQDTPAAYFLTYMQLLAAHGISALVEGGNARLWSTLADELSSRWGASLRLEAPVARVHSTQEGAHLTLVDRELLEADEVILAVPPRALASMLDDHDPRLPHLERISSYGYHVSTVRTSTLPREAGIYVPESRELLGDVIALRIDAEGWAIAGHYTRAPEHPGAPELADPVQAPAHAREHVRAMHDEPVELEQLELGPSAHWPEYFPHVRDRTVETLRAVEALQGEGHIWLTGGWLSFEGLEHVARHATHLVLTCFDPALAGED